MTRLDELSIFNVRNIESAHLKSLADVNLIHGLNGSGKTSILEALYTLSMTRSFRSRKMKTVISSGASELTVRGALIKGASFSSGKSANEKVNLGVRRHLDNRVLVKLGDEKIASFGQLAGVLPVQLINPDSFKLLEGGPAERRQFLDWSMFHVEHSGFFREWSRYRKALRQRNALLRHGKINDSVLSPWTLELARSGEALHQIRAEAFDAISPLFSEVCQKLVDVGHSDQSDDLADLSLAYHPGWDIGSSEGLYEALQAGVSRDLEQGFTRLGPHRADVKVRSGKVDASDRLSRGQIKAVVCSLKIAQSKWLFLEHGLSSVFLIDDLAAELDELRREALLAEVLSTGSQVFASAIQPHELKDRWFAEKSVKRFHVEHGRVTPMEGHEIE